LDKECLLEELGEGVSRKIKAYDENMMIVEVYFEEGSIGKVHHHPHEQITYVLEGKFTFIIDGEETILTKGDSAYKQPNIKHGVVCLEKGTLLDVFTPHREDFIK
jgi:quercetin dioxygenase-like cupin family protein